MSSVRTFFRTGRIAWAALGVLLGAALPSARADIINGTSPTGEPVSILVNLSTLDGAGAPVVLSNNGTLVTLALPETGPETYRLLFGMKTATNFLNLQDILSDPSQTPDPPSSAGQFSYVLPIGNQKYTIAGTILTTNPINPDSWQGGVIPGLNGFPQVGEFFFSTQAGDPTLSFSLDDPSGHPYTFTDPDKSKAPEPASLALAGLGFVGLAGYGWRRRLTV